MNQVMVGPECVLLFQMFLMSLLLVFETLQHQVYVQNIKLCIAQDLNKAPYTPNPLIRPDRNLRQKSRS